MNSNDRKNKTNKCKLIKELENLGTYILHLGKYGKREEKVHVKISNQRSIPEDEFKYNKEVQALKDFKHKNVVKMLDAWIDEDSDFRIVTEYLDTNLSRVMKKRGRPFTEVETKNIMIQFLEGLDHVHKKNFMHRHIKPDALKCDPEATIVKISDFTNALPLDAKQMVKMKETTVRYLAPEMLLPMLYSTPVDMWAAGCIMVELLTGEQLFRGDNDKDQLAKISTVLGTFTRAEWPQGFIEAKNYGLTAKVGTGLETFNFQYETNEFINSLLRWVPEKRFTAEKCLKQKYCNDEFESADIIHNAQQKLQTWTRKHEPNLDQGSVAELMNIMAELSPRKEKPVVNMFEKRNEGTQNSSTSYEQNTSQYDAARSSRDSHRGSIESSKSVQLDEYLRQSARSQVMDSARNSPYKDINGNSEMQQLKQPQQQQQHQQHQQNVVDSNVGGPPWLWKVPKKGSPPDSFDDPFRPGPRGHKRGNFQATKRSMDGQSFRRDTNPIAQSLDDQQPDRNTGALTGRRPPLTEEEQRARMQKQNPLREKAVYGDPFMRSLLGEKPTLVQPHLMAGNNGQSTNDPKRNRNDDFHKTPYEPSWQHQKK